MICLKGFVSPGVRGKTAQNALYGGGASLQLDSPSPILAHACAAPARACMPSVHAGMRALMAVHACMRALMAVRACMHARLDGHACMRAHACGHGRAYLCVDGHACMHMPRLVGVCMHMCLLTCVRACIYACMQARMCMHARAYAHKELVRHCPLLPLFQEKSSQQKKLGASIHPILQLQINNQHVCIVFLSKKNSSFCMICLKGFVSPGVRGKTAQNALYGGGASLQLDSPSPILAHACAAAPRACMPSVPGREHACMGPQCAFVCALMRSCSLSWRACVHGRAHGCACVHARAWLCMHACARMDVHARACASMCLLIACLCARAWSPLRLHMGALEGAHGRACARAPALASVADKGRVCPWPFLPPFRDKTPHKKNLGASLHPILQLPTKILHVLTLFLPKKIPHFV
jgi:hypothetical protein